MKSIYSPALLGIMLSTLSGCGMLSERGSQPPSQPQPAAAAEAAKPELPFKAPAKPRGELDADLVYSYLLAEMAAQRGELTLSYRHYLHAATVASDAYAAERATRIAVYLNDRPGALQSAQRWVELDPNAQNARMSLALLLEREGRRAEALAELEALLQISEALGQDGFVQIGRVLAKEDADQLLPLMQELVTQHAEDARAHFGLAVVAVAAKALDEAEASLQRAVSLVPDRPDMWVMLARVQHARGHVDAALAGLSRALKDMPDSHALRLAYARMLVDVGRHGEALAEFRRLLDETPDDATLVYAAAMLAMHEQQWEEAQGYWQALRSMGGDKHDEATYFLAQVEERLEHDRLAAGLYESIKDGPLLMDAGLRLAQLEARGGEIAKARERLQRLRVLVPGRAADATLAEAQILKEAGLPEEAGGLFDEALGRQPDNIDLRYARAMFAVEQDDLETMEADLRYILSIDPDHVESLNALGYTLADRTDRYEEAFAYILHAYRLEPESAAILDSLGWVYYRMGDLANALKYLQQALGMVMDAEIAAHLGEVLWVTGDRAQARRVWERGLEQTPDSRHIRDAMQRLE